MVTITDYAKRTSTDGKDFYALILQGGIHMVQSKKTGQYYATGKKASISSTFDEAMCKSLVGTRLEGKIVKVSSEPYAFTIESTGETIPLNYRWQFIPEDNHRMEEEVFDAFKTND